MSSNTFPGHTVQNIIQSLQIHVINESQRKSWAKTDWCGSRGKKTQEVNYRRIKNNNNNWRDRNRSIRLTSLWLWHLKHQPCCCPASFVFEASQQKVRSSHAALFVFLSITSKSIHHTCNYTKSPLPKKKLCTLQPPRSRGWKHLIRPLHPAIIGPQWLSHKASHKYFPCCTPPCRSYSHNHQVLS